MKYLINYDLKAPGRNYDDLINAIKGYGTWANICRSCWAIISNQTAVQIRDTLKQYIDKNDVLFVCEFDDWASYGLSQEVANWLKR